MAKLYFKAIITAITELADIKEAICASTEQDTLYDTAIENAERYGLLSVHEKRDYETIRELQQMARIGKDITKNPSLSERGRDIRAKYDEFMKYWDAAKV